MIKAVVFDFDGLIFDTETYEFRVFQEIYKEHGAELTLEVWSQVVGTDTSVFNPYEYLEQCAGRKLDYEEIRRLRHEKFERMIQHEVVRPGVEDYLKEAKKSGLKIGLASSSYRNWVEKYLLQFGLLDYFECIRTRDYVKKVKPDPELYRQALDCLQVEPDEAVAFEDSPNGSLAAKRAGMYCVIVPNSITRGFTFGDVDLRLESMAEMDLKTVIQKIENKK